MSKLFCVSGTLGLKKDWSFLEKHNLEISAHSAEEFLDLEFETVFEKTKSTVALGYSLGGRIILSALAQRKVSVRGAIIISSNPGIVSEVERKERRAADKIWAQNFLSKSWNELMWLWDSQEVFQGSRPLIRLETDYNRSRQSQLLEKFSLGVQADLRPSLSRLNIPILFMAGEKDQKYNRLAKEMASLNPHFKFDSVPGVGHRVPWELKEEEFVAKIKGFLEELK